MIEIELYTNKNYADLKIAFGMYVIKKDSVILDSKILCFRGPCVVGTIIILCAFTALRSLKNLYEPVVFKCNNEQFKKLFKTEDGLWVEKITNSNTSMYVFLLRQEIENRTIKFGIENISSESIDECKTAINNSRSKIKNYGLENNSNNSSE